MHRLFVVISCNPLSSPANGDVAFSSTEFGAIATYSCNDGFKLIGSKTRTCQLDSQWSGSEPFCQRKIYL